MSPRPAEGVTEEHKHRCMRCEQEFTCRNPRACMADYDVIPNIAVRNSDGSIDFEEHCSPYAIEAVIVRLRAFVRYNTPDGGHARDITALLSEVERLREARLTPEEIRLINQAAAFVQGILDIPPEQRTGFAERLFALAGNPVENENADA